MRNQNREKTALLLSVLLMMLCGCSGPRGVYFTEAGEETDRSGRDSSEAHGTEESGAVPENGRESARRRAEVSGDGKAGSSGGAEASETDAAASAEGMAVAETGASGYVYVCGAVLRPGVYPLRVGMRVFEALELAGGFSEEADPEWINQAQVLTDGQRLYIYSRAETALLRNQAGGGAQGNGQAGDVALASGAEGTSADSSGGFRADAAGQMWADGNVSVPFWEETLSGPSGQPQAETAAGADSGKVNLNSATKEELMTLPGIGEAKAETVIAYREEHGPFSSIEEIQKIRGIKDGIFSKIKDRITV